MDHGHLIQGQVRAACDTEHLDALVPMPVIFTYSDLFPHRDEYLALQDRLPHSDIVLGDRGLGDPTGLSTWCDVERFALKLEDAPRWHDRQHDAGHRDLTVYGSLDRYPAINHAMGDRPFYRFIAAWNNARLPDYPWAIVQVMPGTQINTRWDFDLIWDINWHRPQAQQISLRLASPMGYLQAALGQPVLVLHDLLPGIFHRRRQVLDGDNQAGQPHDHPDTRPADQQARGEQRDQVMHQPCSKIS